jgi:cellulose synthase/poly-beta-1,6-N-acetylglucosamine synthase-like glycosyltransferase
VLLPVRDGAAHLDETLRSLEAQTFPDFEVIAVDDGSGDETPAILRAWCHRDPRVRVIRQQPAGIVSALEHGRAVARGRYLARMDADDVCEPRRLAAQLALLESERQVALCGCGVSYFPASEVQGGARRYGEWLNAAVTHEEIARDIFVECPLAHPTFFMRRSAMEAVGGYRETGWPEDYDLVLRLWAAGSRFGKVPDVLLRWREGPTRLSRTDARYSPEAFLACKVAHLRLTLLVGSAGVVIWGAGPIGKAAARALAEAGTPVRAFVDVDPRKLGQEIHGVPVLDAGEASGIRGARHLAAVGRPGARERLRDLLAGAGFEELRDFVAIA